MSTGTATTTIAAGGALRGTLRVPGDKSISHRALLFSALAEGTSTIAGLSRGDDVVRTRLAMAAMGAQIHEELGTATTDGPSLTVRGGRSRLHEPDDVIDLGNSGTGMRLMAGWCAAMPWLTVLTGDASLRSRPMWRVVEPLRRMGAQIDGRSDGRLAPLAIRGGNLQGIAYTPPAGAAQPKSAVLIAGLAAAGETVVTELLPTRVHTEEMVTEYGADLRSEPQADGTSRITVRPSELRPFHIDVPGDPSQAAFWVVAALVVPGSDVTIENLYVGPARAGLLDVLVRMGGDIELRHRTPTTADVRVRHSELRATDIGGAEVPSLIDELPVLAVAAAMAEGTTNVRDAAEMRVKESDRIAEVVREIGGLGMRIEERPDGFSITGAPGQALRGGVVHAGLDHRIAMTAAVAALVSDAPVDVIGWESVSTSYPSFLNDLTHLKGPAT